MLDPHRARFAPEPDAARRFAADPTAHPNAPRVGSPEGGSKALRRALRIEAAEALQARAQGADAQRQQGLEVGLGDRAELEPGCHAGTV